MSYNTIALCAYDAGLEPRIKAAYAKEQEDVNQPDPAYYAMRWVIAGDPSIEPAYESAVLNNHPNPGADESVITDSMLLAAVQANPYVAPPNQLIPSGV